MTLLEGGHINFRRSLEFSKDEVSFFLLTHAIMHRSQK